jgi:hypothetical protein
MMQADRCASSGRILDFWRVVVDFTNKFTITFTVHSNTWTESGTNSMSLDGTFSVTLHASSIPDKCVPELFPSKGMKGESNGEFIGENFTHF